MIKLHIPITLWTSVLAALEERIAQAAYDAPDEFDDEEHKASHRASDTAAREALNHALAIEIPDTSPEAEARRAAIIGLARENCSEGGSEIDMDAILSEGDDNGCYVSGWIWADFSGTPFDNGDESEDESEDEDEDDA